LSERMARKQRGSANRRKARRQLANEHEHIANQRAYWLWGLAREYAIRFDSVTLVTRPSKPVIQYAPDEKTARTLCDAAYAKFEHCIKCKCEEFETELLIKDRTTWQQEKANLMELARLEEVERLWRATKRAWKSRNPKRLQSLARDCERVRMRQS